MFDCLKAVGKRSHVYRQIYERQPLYEFSKWRKATEKLNEHERSELHSVSIQKLAALNDVPIDARLSSTYAKKQATARHCLELLFRTIQLLGSKGIAFRGNTAHKGILYDLMRERIYDLPEERKWIEGRSIWMSDTIQNEIIAKFAHAIQREIASCSSHCRFYGLTADGTVDISTTKQFSCSLKYVDSSFDPHTVFWGFYNARDSTGETLFSCIKDDFFKTKHPH